MAIYITGDVHGEPEKRLSNRNLKRMGKRPFAAEDLVLIAGDFGLPWNASESDSYRLNWMASREYTVVFVDGNHENFNMLNDFPVISWNGGRAHQLRHNLFHLMRGEIYEIQGRTFFVFGGGTSVDRMYRKENISWWPEEIYSSADYDNALHNLSAYHYEVDYVITHTAPAIMAYPLIDEKGQFQEKLECPTLKMLTELEKKITYKHWFFGHFHQDVEKNQYSCLYHKIRQIY
ncbi:metallophosphoesterase family protein [Anaerospora hongkongensis]|uniref:metallophosphoesterase family protein n=1 Tax=Anaerospora hongkongensis TaxID=244830 RepID=UPI00289E24F7|nr:metallophosphoesterase [Anaerospora hongkongensis]